MWFEYILMHFYVKKGEFSQESNHENVKTKTFLSIFSSSELLSAFLETLSFFLRFLEIRVSFFSRALLVVFLSCWILLGDTFSLLASSPLFFAGVSGLPVKACQSAQLRHRNTARGSRRKKNFGSHPAVRCRTLWGGQFFALEIGYI